MNKPENIKFVSHFMLGCTASLAEIMSADETQPPNVQTNWLKVQKSALEAMTITLADLRVSAFDQESAPQQLDCIR